MTSISNVLALSTGNLWKSAMLGIKKELEDLGKYTVTLTHKEFVSTSMTPKNPTYCYITSDSITGG